MANKSASVMRVRVHGVVLSVPVTEYEKMLVIGMNPEIVIDDNLLPEVTDKGTDKGTNKGTDKGTNKGTDKGTDKGTNKGTNKGKDNPVRDARSNFLKALNRDNVLSALNEVTKGDKTLNKRVTSAAKDKALYSLICTQYDSDSDEAKSIAAALDLGDPILLVVSNAPIKLSGSLAMLGFNTKRGKRPYTWLNGKWVEGQAYDAVTATINERDVTVIRLKLRDKDNVIRANVFMMI